MAEFWVFWILAPISLGSAIAMILMRNAVHSALMLVLNFFTLAALYAVLEAQFLAVVQIIVYAGAIMVLFLFVLMLLGIARDQPLGGPLKGQKTAAVALGVVLVIGLSVGVAGPWMGAGSVCGAEAAVTAGGDGRPCAGLVEVNAQEGGNIRQIGLLLFTDYVWPFEVMSVLLVIAALGAMVLGRRREHPSELVDGPREDLRVAVRAPLRATTSESGPSESGPSESGPSESGPPESAPPASGPPESAPPGDAAAGEEPRS